MRDLGWRELQVLAARLIAEIPAVDTEDTITNAVPVITNSDGSGG